MSSTDTIIQINAESPNQICASVAKRVKQRRLELNLTQEGLSARSDVNLATYRKFERTGDISLRNLVKIALSLNSIDAFQLLFEQKQYQSINDVLNSEGTHRKRGKKL
jgi:transcriptional regulator with XRE-family HTH domain